MTNGGFWANSQAPITSLVEIPVADVAVRVDSAEPTYDKAVQRNRTINEWIERRIRPLDSA